MQVERSGPYGTADFLHVRELDEAAFQRRDGMHMPGARNEFDVSRAESSSCAARRGLCSLLEPGPQSVREACGDALHRALAHGRRVIHHRPVEPRIDLEGLDDDFCLDVGFAASKPGHEATIHIAACFKCPQCGVGSQGLGNCYRTDGAASYIGLSGCVGGAAALSAAAKTRRPANRQARANSMFVLRA